MNFKGYSRGDKSFLPKSALVRILDSVFGNKGKNPNNEDIFGQIVY